LIFEFAAGFRMGCRLLFPGSILRDEISFLGETPRG
jgi:hypothetical protein